jgi:hypothetical protein
MPLVHYDTKSFPQTKDIKVIPGFAKHLIEEFQTVHGKDKYFSSIFPLLSEWLLLVDKMSCLWEINLILFERVKNLLDIDTPTVFSLKRKNQTPTGDVIQSILQNGCDAYYSGPHGKLYLDQNLFDQNGIKLIFQDSEEIYYNYSVSIVSTISQIGLLATKEILNLRKIAICPK